MEHLALYKLGLEIIQYSFNEPVAAWSSFVCTSSNTCENCVPPLKRPLNDFIKIISTKLEWFMESSCLHPRVQCNVLRIFLFFHTLLKQTTAYGLPKWHDPNREGSTSSVWTIILLVGGCYPKCSL